MNNLKENKSMCPECGQLFMQKELIPNHAKKDVGELVLGKHDFCQGSQQTPRNPFSDKRLLWNGKPNPHFGRGEN